MVNQTSICELHHAKVHSFTNLFLHDFFQGSKVMLVMRTAQGRAGGAVRETSAQSTRSRRQPMSRCDGLARLHETAHHGWPEAR